MESCEGAASVTEYDPFISENIDLPIWPRSEKQEPELMPDNKADFRIIPTKLNRPAIDSRWIVRPRLLSAFDDALGRKLRGSQEGSKERGYARQDEVLERSRIVREH